MIALVIFTIVVIATAVVVPIVGEDGRERSILAGIGGGLAGIVLVCACITHVGSNEVGIVNNFGSYQSTDGPGFHPVSPWSTTEKFSTRIKFESVENAPVKLKAESENVVGYPASVDFVLRYHIDGVKHAEKMWRQYRTFAGVQKQLVTPQAKTSVREVFGKYIPAEATAGGNVRNIGNEVAENLQRVLTRSGIVVDSINITDVGLPRQVEERLASIQAADANRQRAEVDADARLQVAKTDRETAAQQAQADKLRRATATRETLVQECLATVKALHTPMDCNYYKQNDGYAR